MGEKLSFKDLIEKYDEKIEILDEIMQEIDVEELEEEIKINNIDIERLGKEDNNLLLRVNELTARLEQIKGLAFEYDIGPAQEECENKILEVEELREKNNSKIEKLKEENVSKQYNIDKFNKRDEEKKKIDEEIIKEAEDRTEKINKELFNEIDKLNETIEKFGAGGDEGHEKQYTQEEKIVIDRLKSEIEQIKKQIDKNNIMLKFFKDNLGKNKDRRKEKKNQNKAEKVKEETNRPEQVVEEPSREETNRPEQAREEEPSREEVKRTQTIIVEQRENDEFEEINSGRKPEISRIMICPITNTIAYEVIDEKGIYGVKEEELDYTDEFVKGDYIKNILKQERFGLDESSIEDIIGEVDPNIVKVLEENDNEALEKYIKSINNLEKMPMDIEYDLKDMYKTDMLFNKEKSNLSKIAKTAEKLGVKVEKDNIFKRAFDKLKSMLSIHTRKALVEDNKTYGKVWEEYSEKETEENDIEQDKEMDEVTNGEKEEVKKERYKPKHFAKNERGMGKALKDAAKAFRDAYRADGNQEEVVEKHLEEVNSKTVEEKENADKEIFED